MLQVKDNQKSLADALREFFERGEEAGYGKLAVEHDQVEKDHGRYEPRHYTWINDLSWMDRTMRDAWKKLGGVGMIKSSRRVDGKESSKFHYGIGSTGVKTVKTFAHATRAHWGIKMACTGPLTWFFAKRNAVPEPGTLHVTYPSCANMRWPCCERTKFPSRACGAADSMLTVMRATVNL